MVTETLRHYYKPYGACREIFNARDPELLISGPAGTGKSRACLEKLNMMALLNPGMRGLIVRKTHASLTSTGLVTFREKVLPEALANGVVRWYGGSSQEPPQYRYVNGSTFNVGGMNNADRIMSSEYDVIYVQEATELTEEDWEKCTTRLRNGVIKGSQQLIADCNPDVPHHWLKQRCDKGTTRILESRHEDNPTLFGPGGEPTEFGRAYLDKLNGLTGVRLQRLRYGKWVAAEGLVYEDWDPAKHLIDRFDIPEDWPRFWSVDFGYTNPFVCQMWAEDPDGRLYLYREFYRTKRTVDQHAQEILSVVAPDGKWIEPRPRAIIADHDAEGREVFQRELGISTTPARKAVEEGIQATQSRLRVVGAKPRLMLLRDSLVSRDASLQVGQPACTAEEIIGYIWEVTRDKVKENPVKKDDHGCDAMRYMVAYRDLAPKPRIRIMGGR